LRGGKMFPAANDFLCNSNPKRKQRGSSQGKREERERSKPKKKKAEKKGEKAKVRRIGGGKKPAENLQPIKKNFKGEQVSNLGREVGRVGKGESKKNGAKPGPQTSQKTEGGPREGKKKGRTTFRRGNRERKN